MNGPDRTYDQDHALRRLIHVLGRRHGPGGAARTELLARVRAVLDGTTEDAALLELVAGPAGVAHVVEDEWAEADAQEDVEPADVAAVLDRQDHGRAVPVPDAAAADAWLRELGQLLRVHDAGPDAVDLVDLAERALIDPSLAETVVEAMGVPWAASGMRGLHEAARRGRGTRGRRDAHDVSGFAGARTLDPVAVLAQLQAPLDDLPRVRGRDRMIARLTAAVLREGAGDFSGPGYRRTPVLTGAAGYGKSTVALAVARRVRAEGVTALRIAAETRDELVDGLYLAAVALRAPLVQLRASRDLPLDGRAAALWSLLDCAPVPWLLVLDGAGPGAVGDPDWLPPVRTGAVVVTTRYGGPDDWGTDADVVGLDRLRPAQGGLVVLDRIGAPRTEPQVDDARALSRALGGVPLALSSAGRYAAARGGAAPLSGLRVRVGARTVPDPVSTVYELGVLPDPATDRRTAIRLLACFAPDTPLPLAVLDGWTEVVGGPRPMLDDLVRTGLVEERAARPGSRSVIAIHPAVAEESRHDDAVGLAPDVVDGWAVALLGRAVRALDAGAPATWATLRMLEPHVSRLLASRTLGAGDLLARTVRLAERTVAALLRAGSHAAAHAMLDAAVARATPLDPADPAVLALRHTRARATALDGGDFAAAVAELTEVVGMRTRLLGDRHPDTLDSRDCLAWVTSERGLPAEARAQFAEVLAARRAVLGPDHPDTLETQHRLGWVDAETGRVAEAVEGLTDVLRRRQARLGRYHLDVFGTRYRLGWTHAKNGDQAAAEQTYLDLQADVEHALGRLHPMTLMVRVRVAWVLVRACRFDEAERMYADALADQVRVLGATHRRTLRTRQYLGCLALDRGDWATAAERTTPVLAERERVLGSDHPHTLNSRSYLTTARLHAGRYDAADRIFQSIVADRERVLGPAHEVTLRSRVLLARARIKRGRLGEARMMLERLHDDVVAALPADHRVALDVRHTRALVEGLLGDAGWAEAELRSVHEIRLDTLGADHRETLAGRDYLAWALGRQGRYAPALALGRAVLADRERVLGPDHADTFQSRYSVAWLRAQLGDVEAARSGFSSLLADLRARFGDDRPDVMRARHGLVRLRLRSGDAAGALADSSRLVADQVRFLGPDAVDTLRAVEEHAEVLIALPGRAVEGWGEMARVRRRRILVLGDDHPDTVRVTDRLSGGSGR
ncbi:tetratricopeptide repeat protein [Pseudonocardia nematodicida]|uniref:Tetratricopeptide repeat protein n=1 Tax=Pseudonocardia nematodicida TaxID=1206997 RepID=A0ABV1K3L9_9PSEU